MLYVVDARNQHGWGGDESRLDDSGLQAMIGRRYRTVREMLRAATRAEDRNSYAAVEYLDETTGERWVRGTEPALPGRSPLCRYLGVEETA